MELSVAANSWWASTGCDVLGALQDIVLILLGSHHIKGIQCFSFVRPSWATGLNCIELCHFLRMQADGSDESHRKETTSHKVWEPGNQIQILYQQILKWKVYQIFAPCCSLGLSSWQRLNSQESAWSHSWESSHAWPLVDSPHAVCHPKAQHRNIVRKPPPVRIVEVMVGHLQSVFHILKVGSVNVSCVTIIPPWQSSKESENPKLRQDMNKVEAESVSISFISLWYWRIAVTAIKTNLPLLRWSLHSSRSCHRNLHALWLIH